MSVATVTVRFGSFNFTRSLFMHIAIEDLHFTYGKKDLYKHLSVQVDQPGVYGVFGPNGSGKSTLLKLLAGLLTPHSGTMQVMGYVPRQRNPHFLSQVYFLPEEFHLPNLTPQQQAATQSSFYPQFSHALFEEYLTELQVPADTRFGDMSLGQKKKATVAFALATLTPVLMMDEPTNGLDVTSRQQFKRLIRRPEHVQRTILISTHQAHDLEGLVQHIWFIDGGRIMLSTSMQALSQRIHMGVADSAETLPSAELILYQEPIGRQIAWVARHEASVLSAANSVQDEYPNTSEGDGQDDDHGIGLEMLHKALSMSPDAIRAANAEAGQVNTTREAQV